MQGAELDHEKRKDYRNAVFVQVTIIVMAFMMEDLLRLAGINRAEKISWLFLQISSGVYLLLLWDMLRNFTRKREMIWSVLLGLSAVYATLFYVNVSYYSFGVRYDGLRVVCHCTLVLVEFLVIAHAVRDLFHSPRNTVDKLWGTACIYFMSGYVFASLFHIIHMIEPGAFGQEIGGGHQSLFESLYLSFNSLVGLDTAYPNSIRLMRNVAVLEGLWGQLYLVLLIGRVLMPADGELPKRPGEKDES